MATSGIFFYSQIDVQGKYYPSKGDIIVFNVNVLFDLIGLAYRISHTVELFYLFREIIRL